MSQPKLTVLLTIGWILAGSGIGVSPSLAQDTGAVRKGPVTVELLAERDTAKPGETVWLGLKFTLDPDWHVYWINPGTAGYPPSVEWRLGSGIAVDPLRFPVPKVFKTTTGKASFGYDQTVLLVAPARIAADAGDSIPIRGMVKWLACNPKTCVPGEAELSLTLKTAGTPSAIRPEFEAAIAALPQPSDWKMTASVDADTRRLQLRITPDRAPFELKSLAFYPEQPRTIDGSTAPTFRWEGKDLAVETSLAKELTGTLPEPLSGLLLAGDGSLEKPLVLSTAPLAALAQLPDLAGGGQEPVKPTTEAPKKGGAGAGWGSWLQQPVVVITLAALMFTIGLNLLGVFEIGAGLTGAGGALRHIEGPAGSFLSGGLATIVATPCTAPFMGSALFYALGQPPLVTFLIFSFLGLGMAAPYLVLSRSPQLLEKLPRPGAWMETLKQGFAFPMFAVVIWLVWVLSFQVSQNGLLAALAALLLLAIGAWWYGRFATPVARSGVRLAAQAGPALLVGIALVLGNHAGHYRLPAKTQDVEARIRELQAQGKGVFVDFTAAWCLTCQANKVAMHSERVQAALAAKGVQFLEVDWTQKDPEIHRVLQKYGSEGVPLYLLFPGRLQGEPTILPNLLTEEIILSALEDGRSGAAGGGSGKSGFWGALAGAFLGGLILNLMPCVFPVISLKILGFVSQAGSDRKRVWQHGLAFAAGVLVFFWGLAAVLLVARAGFQD